MQEGQPDLKTAILDIHRRLFERIADAHVAATAGQWKRYANCTSDYDSPNGMFFYTRPASTAAALAEWEAFTLATGGPELVRQMLSHWMFEHIHPVADGNGRVGRLLVPLLLRRKSATTHACCFIGEAVHTNKDLYIDALKRGRLNGDMTHWTRLLLSFAAWTAERNLARLERAPEIHGHWQRTTAGFRSHSLVQRLVPLGPDQTGLHGERRLGRHRVRYLRQREHGGRASGGARDRRAGTSSWTGETVHRTRRHRPVRRHPKHGKVAVTEGA